MITSFIIHYWSWQARDRLFDRLSAKANIGSSGSLLNGIPGTYGVYHDLSSVQLSR
jgi:hypothetical protein